MTDIIIDQSCPDLIRSDIEIYLDNDEFYCFTLNQTDIANNCNKFLIVQLLVRADKLSFFLVSRSGRVGYKGTDNIDCYLNLNQAITDFKVMFREKTGFSWEDRATASKVSGKYDYIEMKYEKKEELTKIIDDKPLHLKLDAKVQQLITMIFDQNLFVKIADQFKLDLKRAPLGAISAGQIKKAYKILDNIAKEIADKKDTAKLVEYSSDFYTVIPTNFGMGKPPIINSDAKIAEKVELLKVLDDAEVMSKLIKKTSASTQKLDKQYLSLDSEIIPIRSSEPLYSELSDYMKKSSGHHYKLKIQEIFKVNRTEEKTRFLKHQNSHNRQLLWHGSRLANFVSIISTGLRINPGNVVRAGSMFGNGLYFANSSTKSAQYMRVDPAVGTGIMLLCEVALGNCYELYNAKYITALPTGHHSTYGVGKHTPHKSGYITKSDGLILPAGKLVARQNFTGALNYDEFIVYNEDQVRIKYLFIVKI